jgi:hypothetical protein
MKKGELKKQLGISTTKFNRVYNPDVIERIIGLKYSDFKRMRILPTFVLDKMLMYWNVGDTYVPEDGIYESIDSKRWAINNIDSLKRTVEFIELDKYGLLGDVKLSGISFDVVRIAYKRFQ